MKTQTPTLQNDPCGEIPLKLSRQEIHLLVHEAQQGSRAASETIHRAFLKMVWQRSARYFQIHRATNPDQGTVVEQEDLVQVARIGLQQAIQTWDPQTAVFCTWAYTQIDGAITHHLRSHGNRIRLASRTLEARARLGKAALEFEQREGRSPTDQELSEILRVPLEAVEATRTSPCCVASLDDPVASPDGTMGMRLGDTLVSSDPAPGDLNPEDLVGICLDGLDTLPQNQRDLLEIHFLDGCTTKEISKISGISEPRVNRMIHQALDTLRGNLMGQDHLAPRLRRLQITAEPPLPASPRVVRTKRRVGRPPLSKTTSDTTGRLTGLQPLVPYGQAVQVELKFA